MRYGPLRVRIRYEMDRLWCWEWGRHEQEGCGVTPFYPQPSLSTASWRVLLLQGRRRRGQAPAQQTTAISSIKVPAPPRRTQVRADHSGCSDWGQVRGGRGWA
jgi:hypothetical protein